MTKVFIEPEHIDLEEIFQISTEVDLGTTDIEFEGFQSFTSEIKMKKEKTNKVEQIELRESKSKNTGSSLF